MQTKCFLEILRDCGYTLETCSFPHSQEEARDWTLSAFPPMLLSDALFLWLPLPSLPQSQDVFELIPESLTVSCSPVICLL